MTVNAQTNKRAPRLNPFIFPSDTDLRFVLLIVAVLGASLYMYDYFFYSGIPANKDYFSLVQTYCNLSAQLAHPGDLGAQKSAFDDCPLSRTSEGLWISLGIALQVSVTGVIYWAYPAWKIWRGGLTQLSTKSTLSGMETGSGSKPKDAASKETTSQQTSDESHHSQMTHHLETYLFNLCCQANLSRCPIFLVNLGKPARSGVAFGHLGRYYVSLSAGLITLFVTDLPAFRAIVLHELGHIRNADVDKTYLTISIGWAFGVVALVPWLVVFFGPWLYALAGDLAFATPFPSSPLFLNGLLLVLNEVWRVLVFVLLIYLTCNAILRTREAYADTRASVCDGQASALGDVLDTLASPKRWQRLFRTHPDPQERRRILDDTSTLFHLSFWDAFATGVAVAAVITDVYMLLIPGQGNGGAIETGMVFAPLVVGIVGSGVWRATFASKVRGEALPSTTRMSIGLAVGLLLGQTLSLFTYTAGGDGYFTDLGFLSAGQNTQPSLLSQVSLLILWSILLLIMLFFFLRWIVACAESWMEVTASCHLARRSYWTALAIASVILSIWFGQFYNARITAQRSLGTPSYYAIVSDVLHVILLLMVDPLTLLASTCLWAYPLAAWFWRKRTATPTRASWAFLDALSQPQPIASPDQAPFHLGLALIVGLAGGVTFCGILALLFSMFHMEIFTFNQFQWQPVIELAVLVQGVTAAIVAGSVQRLGSLHGLFAAFIAGSVGVVALTLLYPAGFHRESSLVLFVWAEFRVIVNGGSLLALPVALTVSILASWIRRLSRHGATERKERSLLDL